MPYHPHHSLATMDEHLYAVINEGWEQEVLPQLPTDCEQQAEQLHALLRHREFQRAGDLLRGLQAYVLCAPSFRHLGGWAILIGLANISHVAGMRTAERDDPSAGQPVAQHTAYPAHRCHPAQAARRQWRRLAGSSGL